MGVVFLAQDRTLDRPVALKFLSDELQQDATARRRFVREAKAAAALDHPYICKIYETGEADGRPFIAMEYVRGETLAARLARSGGATDSSLSLDEVLRIATEIAEALETAHNEGLVHRDLKPSNIMLTTGGHVKVLDFGLAKRVAGVAGEDAATASQLTEAGTVRGTVAYMSPEHVRGQTVDARSDIFAFGVVLYELLTGRHPFQQETTLETAAAILNQTPAPLTHHRQDAPDLLEHILGKLLAKAPADRYQNVHDVRTELAQVSDIVDRVQPAPEDAAIATPAPRMQPRAAARQISPALTWRRRSVIASASLAVAILAVAWVWWGSESGEPASGVEIPSVAVLPLRNVSADPSESDYLADGITRAVITRLAQAELRVTPWDTALRFRDTSQPTEEIGRELNVDTVLVGTFELIGDRILTTLSLVDADSGLLSWADEFEEPYEDLFGVQRRIAMGAAASLKIELTGEEEAVLATPESASVDAYDAYLQGADLLLAGDQESTEVAFDYFTRAVELDPSLADAHVGLGSVFSERFLSGWGGGLGNLDLAEARYETALRLNPADMLARRGLITVHWHRGSSEACLIHGQEAARVGEAEALETLMARAQAYVHGELFDLALPLLRRVIALDPLNRAAYWWFVVAAAHGTEFEDVIEFGEHYGRLFGDDEHVRTFLATAYRLTGSDARARDHYEKATVLLTPQATAVPALATWYQIHALLFAGAFHDQVGQRERAEELWQVGVEQLTARVESDPDDVRMRVFLASFHGFLGERTALIAEEARAFAVDPDFNGYESKYLAAARATLGDTDRAVEILREQLRRGRLVDWQMTIGALSPSLVEAAGFEEFRREYEAMDRRLRERYGPTSSGRRETEDTP